LLLQLVAIGGSRSRLGHKTNYLLDQGICGPAGHGASSQEVAVVLPSSQGRPRVCSTRLT
jgi:hypothetical protein